MEWCFLEGELMVRCDTCTDFFAVDEKGTEVAYGVPEGREAVMPDLRPCRSIDLILAEGENPSQFAIDVGGNCG